jgi:hypothetical protein
MAFRTSRFLAWGVGVGLVAAVAAPLSAAPAYEGDRARGEALFYDHAFSATAGSVPVKVFQALPSVFPEYGREAIANRYGFLYMRDRELPIGFVKAPALGVDRISFNCSLCHTGKINGETVAGMPNRNLRLQEFEEGLFKTLADDKFTADAMVPAIKAQHADLSMWEEAQIRLWIGIAKQQAVTKKPSPHRMGPGRFDLLQTFKTRLGIPAHNFNANMDIAPLFGQNTIKRYPRDGALGGDQDLVRYLIVRLSGDNTPLKNGQVPTWVKDLNTYLYGLEAPKYPHPVNAAKVRMGRQIFRNTCSPCHGTYESYDNRHPNTIIPLSVVGTDPNRVAVWDPASIAFVNKDPLMKRLDLKPGEGMMPPSLRGVWATAPYLHNGSVPTVYDVLSSPESRPAKFYRGQDGLDPVKLGLTSIESPSSPDQFLMDTTIPGNGNQGHPFGVPLSEQERWAVIEYLKTL